MENQILKQLEKEGNRRRLPARLLQFYQSLFRIQFKAERFVCSKRPLPREVIRSRIEQGVPLVSFDELDVDWSLFWNTLAKIIALLSDYDDLFGDIPTDLAEIKPDISQVKESLKAWLGGAKSANDIPSRDFKKSIVFEMAIRTAIRPFMIAQAKALHNQIDQERWRREYCPICGGKPDFAYLDRERGARWLLCSRCDTEWLFQRLQCPYCGSQNQDDLAYFTDEEGIYRLYVCEQCRSYIKAVDLRNTKLGHWLPLERVLTFNMDREAQQKKYLPGNLEVDRQVRI